MIKTEIENTKDKSALEKLKAGYNFILLRIIIRIGIS